MTPFPGQVRVLFVKGDHPARQPLILQGAPKDPRVRDRQSVVGEADRSSLAELRHPVSSSPAIPRVTVATNPTGIEASRSARSRTEPSTAAESIGGEVLAIAITAQNPPAAARVPVSRSSFAPGPGPPDGRAGRRRPGRRATRPRPSRHLDLGAPPGSASSAITPSRTTRSRLASSPLADPAGGRSGRSESPAAGPADQGRRRRALGSVRAHAHAGWPIVGVSAGAGPRSGVLRSLPASSS